MSSVTYYDMLKHWNEFAPFLNHPLFIEKVQHKLYWDKHEDKDLYKKKSQMEIFDELIDDIDLTDDEINEMEFFRKKAREHGPGSLYWWSALHDCIESSSLLMGTLLMLKENKNDSQIFVISIKIEDMASHQVICDVPMERGTTFKLTKGNAGNIIIYDLINPVYDEYEPFLEDATCTVLSCNTLKYIIYETNYYGDYKNKK